jgi:hypothetical protein
MAQAILTAALLGIGALAAERVAGWFALPRRGVWVAAMAGSILLPALSLLAPGILPRLGILPAPGAGTALDAAAWRWLTSGASQPVRAAIPGSGAASIDLPSLLALGWVSLSFATLAALLWSYRRLRAVGERSREVEIDGMRVRVAEGLGPAVLGLRRPLVLLPPWVLEASEDERRLILLHEREHVASGDGWLLFAAALAVAAVPWSLPLWWQHRRLRAAVETDCDARVLSRGASRRTYGEILIRTAGGRPLLPMMGPAWGESTSQLERRIMRMTEKRPTHRLLRSAPLVALALGVVATACEVAGREDAQDAALATSPSSPASTSAGSAVVDLGDERMMVPTSKSGANPGLRSLGLGTLHWAEGTGPSYRDGKIVAPTGYPVVASLDVKGGLWKGGVRNGDVLLAVNGEDARRPALFTDAHPGSTYSVRVRRGGAEHEFTVTI